MSPVTITTHPYKGRSYILTRPVRPGSVLLRCKPYAAVPDCGSKRNACTRCLRLSSDKTLPSSCQKCQQVFYCSDTCAKADREAYHAVECRFLKELFLGQPAREVRHSEEGEGKMGGDTLSVPNAEGFGNYTLDYLWLLVRVLIKRVREMEAEAKGHIPDPKSLSKNVPAGTFADVMALCSNAELFPPEKISEFSNVAKCLARFVRLHLLPSASLGPSSENLLLPESTDVQALPVAHQLDPLERSLLTLICKEECNSFGLYTFSYRGHRVPRQGYGLGLYSLAVFFNHSCSPNVGHITRDSSTDQKGDEASSAEMVFYATKEMKEGDEALISYVELDDGGDGSARRRGLEETFFFQCDCLRCTAEQQQPENAYVDDMLCERDGCRGWFAPSHLSKSAEAHKGLGDRNDSGKDLRVCSSGRVQYLNGWICEACGRKKERAV